jgi:spore germination cell wall hydrolase CwlJ-like protein
LRRPAAARKVVAMRFVANLRFRLWMFWWRTDKGPLVLAAVSAAVAGGLGYGFLQVSSYKDESQASVRDAQQRDVKCLALNVYHEARGEPLAGQYAVAEVTMNRRASRFFPRSVCEVVYQKNWDAIRRRYVGAFSWTELEPLPEPRGAKWLQAQRIAEAVYFGKRVPEVQGAMFYHASYIKPDWAKDKTIVARIGRHVFYR